MNFLNPAIALAGLACVAIPIVIHLLMRRRRKPVQWAAMRFLLEAYRQQRRRLRLEQLLLLAARCLVIALVALALGRPYFGEAAAFGSRSTMTLYLLIDNGLASSSQDEGPSALERHKAAAGRLLAQLDPASGDRAALVALGGPADPLVAPPTSDTAALREIIRNLEPTHSATDIPGALSYLAAEFGGQQGTSRTVVAVLSDFLTGSADTDRVLTQVSSAAEGLGTARNDIVLLVSQPAERSPANVSITSVDPFRPIIITPRAAAEQGSSMPAPVRVALRRSGGGLNEAVSTTVRLHLENDRNPGTVAAAAQAVVRWSPGQTEAVASVPLDTSRLPAPGTGSAASTSVVLIASIDADAIEADNTWRRPIEVRRALRVGIVAPRRLGMPTAGPHGLQQFESADWVRLALSPMDMGLRTNAADSEIEVSEIEPLALDQTRLAGLDAAVITRPDLLPDATWLRLRGFADSGGLIIVVPPPDVQVHLWPDPMIRELGLNWSIAREAQSHEQALRIAADRSAAGGGESREAGGLLALLGAELPELAPPVGISRILPVERSAVEGEQAQSRIGAVLQLQNGLPLVLASHPGVRDRSGEGDPEPSRGLVILLTTAFHFDWTDLQARPLMVPLLHELVRQGVGQAIGSRVQLAGAFAEVPPRTAELRSVGGEGARVIRVDAARARTDVPIRSAGLWSATDERGVARSLIGVNADPWGGRTDAQSDEAIRDWLLAAVPGGEQENLQWIDAARLESDEGAGSLHSIFDRRANDALFAFPLLLAALAIALVEVGMARWFSHAVRPGAPSAPAAGPVRT